MTQAASPPAQEAYLNNHWRFNAKSIGRPSLADFDVL